MQSTVASLVVDALLPLLLAALSWASVQLTLWLRVKVKNDAARRAAERLTEVVEVVVGDLMQTSAAKLKELSADGKLSKEEARVLRAAAAERAMALLVGEAGAASKRFCKEFGCEQDQLEHLVHTKIEATVGQLKPWMPLTVKKDPS